MRTQLYNLNWLNANSGKNYPLEDCANKISDTGVELPDDLIVDINLWVPNSYGQTVFVSSITSTTRLVSITLCSHDTRACQSAGTSGQFIPVASLALVKPVSIYTNYALVPYASGVGGWVIFGPGINRTNVQAFTFSDPAQSTILSRMVRSYPTDGVTSLSKYQCPTLLQGLVSFKSQNQDLLDIRSRSVVIGGQTVQAIVFGLNEDVQGPTVYPKYLGPCDGRPESNTCNKIPIHNINSATPYCDGSIKLYITEITNASKNLIYSYASMSPNPSVVYTGPNTADTVALDYAVGTSTACGPALGTPTGDYNKTSLCDTPCDNWANDPPSPLPNICFSWYTGRLREPNLGGPTNLYGAYSQEFSINTNGMTGSTALFSITGSCAGVLMMLGTSETMTLTNSGPLVDVLFPADVILINNTNSYLVIAPCDDGVSNLGGSIEKSVNVVGGGFPYTLPAGTTLTNCSGSLQVSDLATGLSLTPVSLNTVFTLSDFPGGWIDGSGILRIKFGLLLTGEGFASIQLNCQNGITNSNRIPI